jgi:predicted permease
MDTVFRELRYAYRLVSKDPSSSLVAVIAMALGIGLTASMYSVLGGVFLRGLPFEESENLIHLEVRIPSKGVDSAEVSVHDFKEWREQQDRFEGLIAFGDGTVNLSDQGLPERFDGAWISPGFLKQLRVSPILGRGFEPADEVFGAPQVLLLAHHVWKKRYGSDPQVIGRVVQANSMPATVIGVLPQGFRFPVQHEVWLPLQLDLAKPRGEESLEVFGRLKEGVTLDQAAIQMTTIAGRLEQQFPETNEGMLPSLKPYVVEFIGEETILLMRVMFSLVLLVLLVACINVANLLIGRASSRGKDLAIRSALGAGRWSVVVQVFTEALLLSAVGSVCGIGLAHFALSALDRAMVQTEQPFWIRFEVDGNMLAFTAGLTVLAAFLAALLPALQATGSTIGGLLQDAGRGNTSFRLGRLSRGLVILEVAISFALLVGAGLMVRSVLEASNFDLQFEPDRILTARIGLAESDYPEESEWLAFFEDLQARLEDRPDVESVAVASVIPADTKISSGSTRFERPGETYEETRDMPLVRQVRTNPGYFKTFDVPLLAGRDFDFGDRAETAAVALVNQAFAQREWPGENPIGQRIDLWMGDALEAEDLTAGQMEVVGLVPDLRFGSFSNDEEQEGMYVPLAQAPMRFEWVIVKTRQSPVDLIEPLRRVVQGIDPGLPIYFVRPMDKVLERTLFFPNLFGVMFSTFGVAALLLASIGLYGVMAFGVTRRTQEMGVRMAFGASRGDVLNMVLKQGLRQVVVGLVMGLGLAMALASLLSAFLFQVEPMDPLTFTFIPALLLVVSLLACVIPARKASSVNPLVALRHD